MTKKKTESQVSAFVEIVASLGMIGPKIVSLLNPKLKTLARRERQLMPDERAELVAMGEFVALVERARDLTAEPPERDREGADPSED